MTANLKGIARDRLLPRYIPSLKDRKSFILALVPTLSLVILILVYCFFNQQWLMKYSDHGYKGFLKQLGSISRIGYFSVILIYPVFLVLKWRRIKTLKWRNVAIKRPIQAVGKFVRQWHAPLAIVSTGVAILHCYLAIRRGFRWDFTHMTGILAMGILVLLIYAGLHRYKRNDRKWHFKLAVGFILLFMIHASF